MLFERGVEVSDAATFALNSTRPSIDSQRPSRGLHLVRHRNVGVQIRVAGPAVPMGEGGCNQAADVDLPDPLRPGPGEQGMLLDERQRVLDGGLMGPFDDSRHRRISDRQ
jgi:hypothetical protein